MTVRNSGGKKGLFILLKSSMRGMMHEFLAAGGADTARFLPDPANGFRVVCCRGVACYLLDIDIALAGGSMNTSAFAEIVRIISSHAKIEGENPTANDHLLLGRYTERWASIQRPHASIFAMLVQGSMSIELGGKVQRFGSGEFLFVSFDVPMVHWVIEASEEQPCLGFCMTISADRLHEVLARMEVPVNISRTQEANNVIVDRVTDDLLNAAVRLLRLLDVPSDIGSLSPLVEQEIIYRLLSAPFGGRLLQLAVADSPVNGIAKAIIWLRRNFSRPLRIPELADEVGMSESTLHHHFKAVTGLTPMQYQKQLRLYEARRLIQLERQKVGNAGYAVGYQSRSQFTREYSRLYGVSPLQHFNESKR